MSSMQVVAQGDIEEVVIEAQKSDNDPIDDLVSVSAIDGEKLADAGIENIEDVAAYVPNLVLTQTETGTNIFIRGIGAGVNQGFDQSVGLYSDGVPLPRGNMARAPFLDLASVQVLRGPQYVLDGNYSIAGSVHMISNLSVDEFNAGVDLNFIPSQNDRTLLLRLGGPINDKWAANLVVQSKDSDGYVENVARNDDGPAKDEFLTRLVLGYQHNDNLNFNLKVEQGSFDTTGRAAEVIFRGEGVPNLEIEAPFPDQIGGTVTRDAQAPGLGQFLPTAFVSEAELALVPQGNSFASADFTDPTARSFFFSGTDYFSLITALYEDTLALDTTRDDLATSPPPGFLDTTLDFRRGADVAEFSENNSLNFTLNTKLLLGSHKLSMVNSYIEYDFDELIDGDFTSLPIIELDQAEQYEQIFNKIEYQSPDDSWIKVRAGVSHQTSDLSFGDVISARVLGDNGIIPVPDARGPEFVDRPVLGFDPTAPFGGFLSRIQNDVPVLQLARFNVDRQFFQEHDLTSAFFQTTIDWSDNFRSTLGVRYTHSEKQATRDLALVNRDGSLPTREDFQFDPEDPAFTPPAVDAGELFLSSFAIQIHTDRLPELFEEPVAAARLGALPALGGDTVITDIVTGEPIDGNRREEQFLPSLTLEWDLTTDFTLRASARMANKLGGFDARANSTPNIPQGSGLPVGSFEFEDETATTYELGFKWFVGGSGEMNATAFFTEFEDLQTSSSDGRAGLIVTNAGGARTTGIEIEGYQSITERLRLDYSLAWIDFEFTEFLQGPCRLNERPDNFIVLLNPEFFPPGLQEVFAAGTVFPIVFPDINDPNSLGFRQPELTARNSLQGEPLTDFVDSAFNLTQLPGQQTTQEQFINAARFEAQFFDSHRTTLTPAFCDFEGRSQQFVADWQGTFSFTYEGDIPGYNMVFSPALDIIYNSGYLTNFSQDPDVAQGEFFQFNGRLSLASQEQAWELAVTMENITNERIITYSQDLPIATGIAATRAYWGISRPPRSIGLNFRYNFF